MSLTLRGFLALLLGVVLVGLAGCGLGGPRYKAQGIIRNTFTTDGPPRIVVDTFNGPIVVMTRPEKDISVKVTKLGGGQTQEEAQQDLENVEVETKQEGNTIRVTARVVPGQATAHRGAMVKLKVPAGTALDLTTSNGRVGAAGEFASVHAKSSNGAIHVLGGTGVIDVQTSNGVVEIESKNALVKAHTSNGGIRCRGPLAKGDHDLHTSNGAITLLLPPDAQFRIDAATSNGKITCAFAAAQEDGGNSTLQAAVGSNPGATINLKTSNGNIDITPDTGKPTPALKFDDDKDER